MLIKTISTDFLTYIAQQQRTKKLFLDTKSELYQYIQWLRLRESSFLFSEDESRIYILVYTGSETISKLRDSRKIKVKHKRLLIYFEKSITEGVHILLELDNTFAHIPLFLKDWEIETGEKRLINEVNQSYYDQLTQEKPVTLICFNELYSIAFDIDDGFLEPIEPKEIDLCLDEQYGLDNSNLCFTFSQPLKISQQWGTTGVSKTLVNLNPSTILEKYYPNEGKKV
ncbi:hypothetical protein MKY04_18065 [Lysinibacillus telephonicus]|uniref:hypothetical protein n=1 Tax=Lysinibacillus telephonicus TaxID=1714840 RepID=UPI0031FCFBBE